MAVTNRIIAQSAEMGALPALYAATVPRSPRRLVRRPRRVHGATRPPALVTAAGKAYDEQAWRRLWEVSEQLTGVRYEFEPPRRRRCDRPADGRARRRSSGPPAYLERVGELPVLAQVAPGEIRARLPATAPDEGEPFSDVLRDLDEVLLPGVTHWQHPRYFAYFATSAVEPAILAELLAATLNSVAFLWRTAPAATELEDVVLDWVAELLGLPSGWHGHIEDTASTSTLAAIIAAREATGRDLIVCSEQAHSAADKAARMLGMRLRKVPSDDAVPARRRPRLAICRDAAVVVATVGTTASTAVDPVPAIADACQRGGTWLHVDAAYAGTAMVCPEFRWAFAGVDRADSVVVNAHKWMLTPMDCSLLWSRRPEDLRRAFSVVPEFLRTPDAEDALSAERVRPGAGPPVPGAEAVGGAALPRAQRAAGARPQRGRAGGEVRAVGRTPSPGGSCARRGTSRSSASGSTGDDERNRAAARARQRQRRDVHLPRRAGRALRAAAGDRPAEHDRGRRAARLGSPAGGKHAAL